MDQSLDQSFNHLEQPLGRHDDQNAGQLTAFPSTVQPPALSPSPFITQAPFLIKHLKLDPVPSGSFRPAVRLVLMPALRTGSLWHMLPGEEMKTLLMLLTFLTPNGWCRPTLPELAMGMHTSETKARSRLERLAALRWHGLPLVSEQQRENGLSTFVPAPGLLASVQEEPRQWSEPTVPGFRPAGREAVVAYSRARYGRPRAEVERDIAERMGWKEWQDPQATLKAHQEEEAALSDEQRDLLAQLQTCGLDREQAMGLIGSHEPERIRRQLEWLPFRHAKSPARFLLAAVTGNYDAPLNLRRQAAQTLPEPQALSEPQSLPEHQPQDPLAGKTLLPEEGEDAPLSIPEPLAQERTDRARRSNEQRQSDEPSQSQRSESEQAGSEAVEASDTASSNTEAFDLDAGAA